VHLKHISYYIIHFWTKNQTTKDYLVLSKAFKYSIASLSVISQEKLTIRRLIHFVILPLSSTYNKNIKNIKNCYN